VFIQEIADLGFDAFQENSNILSSYIPLINYNEKKLQELLINYSAFIISFKAINHPYKNWNKKWESSFQPILINENCQVRASFHQPSNKKYDIIINPEMSFGTGHHETTRLMAKDLFKHDLKNKTILDFGSGTAILSILSEKLGAKEVDAVEIDENANKNASQNLATNNCKSIKIIDGDGDSIPDKKYDYLLVNINRNTIIEEFTSFLKVMKKNSMVLFSGFFESDIDYIRDLSIKSGLKILYSDLENQWALLVMTKK
ncbi:MAG: 50S ribosomal protein L11 methyltransferase, partial [Flavobacteriales bacterium]|nr:50S ribosomal protein L11 methyltransferase [Flavobacteriales bacterium]